MHSRLNIPAPVGVKAGIDATRKLTMSSKDGAEAQAKAYQRTSCREKIPVVPPVARTANRHRWVSRID
jgi:hypothetical protein